MRNSGYRSACPGKHQTSSSHSVGDSLTVRSVGISPSTAAAGATNCTSRRPCTAYSVVAASVENGITRPSCCSGSAPKRATKSAGQGAARSSSPCRRGGWRLHEASSATAARTTDTRNRCMAKGLIG